MHTIFRRKLFLLSLCLVSVFISSTHSYAGQTLSYTLPQQAYPDSRSRQYKVYLPDNLTSPAPMVMTLHGCKQTHNDVLNDWGMKEAADRYGFILVAPFITSYDGLRNENCWGFWFEQHRHEGGGEVEDLHQIALQVEADHNIDPARRFITGLSSGGAMTIVAATTHNEYWTAAAPAAGLPYGEDSSSVSLSGQCPGYASFHSISRVVSDMQSELNSTTAIPMLILQNENDCTVLKTAADNTRDAHLKVWGDSSHDTPAEAYASQNSCTPYYQNNFSCTHTRYTRDGTLNTPSIVETVYLDGPLSTPNTQDTDHGHYWVSGEHGNNGKWAIRTGPSYPDIIWDFFSRHSNSSGGTPVITLTGDNPLSIALNTAYTDPGATANDAEDGSLIVVTDCQNVNTTAVGDYSCSYSATDSDGNSGYASRTVSVFDPNAPVETCDEQTASPYGHINAGRAYAGGTSNLRALANADNQDIGGSFDSWSSVTLYEGEPGQWYAVKPAACSGSGGGGNTGCQDWNTTNLSHQVAGRAYYQLGYYTTGGNEYLGALSGSTSWIKEETAGVFQTGQCP
ncbi:extracellular catalytic domain type 1 short-chain-length polyhydroxyalkanoate depolymerase [Oceanospirillum sediminis]|nr:PHB depolymerase family esterase [Oceanospirillum sediminis]